MSYLKDKMNNESLQKKMEGLGFKTKGKEMTFEEAMLFSQISSAIAGSTKAFNEVMKHKEERMPLAEFIEENNG